MKTITKIFLSLLILCFSGLFVEANEDEYYSEEALNAPIQHKHDLSFYIEKFCQDKGRSHVRIQNNIIVDCMTAEVLWKVDYADNWTEAFTKALAYPIYDDYRGDEQFAPMAGVVLIQEDSDDYKNMVALKQLVNHYQIPLELQAIESYGSAPVARRKPRPLQNLIIDFRKQQTGTDSRPASMPEGRPQGTQLQLMKRISPY